MTSKKHCDIIKKWADGAEVQFYHDGKWSDILFPTFNDTVRYRIKPEIIRVALHRNGTDSVIAIMWHDKFKFNEIEKYDTFIRWLTEEIEYEM